MDKVKAVAARRLAQLKKADPGKDYEDDYMDTDLGTRGLVRTYDGEDIAALDFIEPAGDWSEEEVEDVLDEYLESLDDGIEVTVIVSKDELADVKAGLDKASRGRIKVLSYDDV